MSSKKKKERKKIWTKDKIEPRLYTHSVPVNGKTYFDTVVC